MSEDHNRRVTLVILGAGGLGREVWSWARAAGWAIRGFLDDNPDVEGKQRLPAPVLGTICDYQPAKDDVFVCAIGAPTIRQAATESIVARGGCLVTIVHPLAIVAESAVIAEGVMVGPFALISVNTRVDRGTVIYYHSSIDHDVVVGPWTQISAHCDVTGGVVIGASVFLGSHATVLPRIRVAKGAVVGAGAVVTCDVPAHVTVVGVPARVLPETRKQG